MEEDSGALGAVLYPSKVRDHLAVYASAPGFADNFHEISFGRWIVGEAIDALDITWLRIKQEMEAKKLSTTGLKSSTGRYNPSSTGPGPLTHGAISVYTTEENTDRVGHQLIALVKRDIVYKSKEASGKYRHKGDRKFTKTLYYNKGNPSYSSSRNYHKSKWKQDILVDRWHLNIARSKVPIELKQEETLGYWCAEAETENLTSLWHVMREKIESGELGPVKMECPTKRRGGQTTRPVVLLYTTQHNKESVGYALKDTKLVIVESLSYVSHDREPEMLQTHGLSKTPPGSSPESGAPTGSDEGNSCTIPKVVSYIRSIKNPRSLGLFLKIDPRRLDDIERFTGIDVWTQIVQEWFGKFPMSDSDRWEELVRVLLEPAVNELPIARRLSPYLRRGSSMDGILSALPYGTFEIESIGRRTEECSILNVLNCIAPYSEWYDIGLCLDLPRHALDEITRYPISDQKLHLVELWYKLDLDFSWRRLQRALELLSEGRRDSRNNDQSSTLVPQSIQSPTTSEPDEDFIKFKEAITENKLIDRKLAHSMFIGPTGSGKSSLMDRLLRRARKAFSTSTGVSDSIVIVDIDVDNPSTFHAATVTDSNTWEPIDHATSLVRQMSDDAESNNTLPPELVQSESESSEQTQPPSSGSIPEMVTATEESMAVNTPEPVVHTASKLSNSQIMKIFETVQKHGGLKKLTKSFSLYLRDTGGQVEFQETISLFIFGPSIFIFVFRADHDFQSQFSVEYRVSENKSTNCYTSSITTEEALLQCLASVYAMDTPGNSGVKTHKPLVLIIATHKDKLGPSADKKIAELNKHLNSLITKSGFQSLVQYADRGKGQVMFTVDNTSESDEDFTPIRSKVHALISRHEEFTIEYPISYLLFSLELQYLNRSILSFDECKDIAARYGIVGNKVFHLLQFLHLRIGVIQYFDVDGLRHIVINEPQVLFSKVTELIVRTFSSFEELFPEQQEDLQKGILTASVFESIFRRKEGITCQEFIKLLKHLHIIALCPPTSPGEQEKRYFMPCVLNHVPKSGEVGLDTSILGLTIQFQCKHCPKGLFAVLVTDLMTPKSDEEEDNHLSFTLMQEKIVKDQVSFDVHCTGVHDEVSLNYSVSHLEINFYPDLSEDRDTPIKEVCNRVRGILDISITKSLEILHYNKEVVKPIVCLKCNHCSEPHPVEKGKQYCKIYCKKVHKTSRIPMEGRCWYNEDADSTPPDSISSQTVPRSSHTDLSKGQTFQSYVSSLPANAHPLLDNLLDWDSEGVDRDLIEIANCMLDWEEKLCTHLGLTTVEISDIKGTHLNKPQLQRREALQKWKSKQGLQATYRNLLKLFVGAEHAECARAVCDVMKEKS